MMIEKNFSTIIQAIAIVIPASLVFYFALSAGKLPDNDYWGFIYYILSDDGGFSTKISDWVQRENEHYVLFPKIIYALNIAITSGNNVALSLFAWFMALLQVFLLYHLIPVRSKQQPVLFTALLFVIAALIFSPTQAHNWFLGMSGVAWISANFFVLSAIFSIHTYANTRDKKFLLLTFIFSLFAIITYSTSLSLFPTLIIATVLLKLKRQEQVIIIALSIVAVALYLSNYSTPSHHPSIQQPANTLVSYFLSFIGALFTKQKHVAIFAAIFGIISALVMLFVIYRKQIAWKQTLPWVLIILYACGNAAMAALARSGFTVDQAFSSRYGSLPALFWISWIMIASVLFNQIEIKYRKNLFIGLVLIGSALIVNAYYIGLKSAKPFFKRAEYKHLTLAALYSHAYDSELIHGTLISGIPMKFVENVMKKVEAKQHIPFNGIFKNCPKLETRLTKIHYPVEAQYFGQVDELSVSENGVVRIRGWANNNNQQPICIALTTGNNIVKGVASYGLSRPDISKAFPTISSDSTGWHGFAKFSLSDKMIKVFMLSSYQGYWIPLKGYYQVLSDPPYVEKIDALPSY